LTSSTSERTIVVLLSAGLGGPFGWAQRVQRKLSERQVVLAVRDPQHRPPEAGTVSFSTARELAGLLRRLEPATVMPNWLWGAYRQLDAMRRHGHDLRIVAHCRSDDIDSYYRPLMANVDYYDAVFAVSAATAQKLSRLIPAKADVIFQVPTFVDRADAPLAPSDGRIRLVYAGRLTEQHKRVSDLVSVAAALLRRGGDFELDIAGDGPDAIKVLDLLSTVSHRGCLRLVGRIPAADMGEFLAGHHIYLQTSSVEGLSNSLLEAMAAGVVPVATNAGATAQVVRDGRNGLLFEPGDIEEAARLIKRLDADRPLLSEMSNLAWRATAPYDFDIAGKALRGALAAVEAL